MGKGKGKGKARNPPGSWSGLSSSASPSSSSQSPPGAPVWMAYPHHSKGEIVFSSTTSSSEDSPPRPTKKPSIPAIRQKHQVMRNEQLPDQRSKPMHRGPNQKAQVELAREALEKQGRSFDKHAIYRFNEPLPEEGGNPDDNEPPAGLSKKQIKKWKEDRKKEKKQKSFSKFLGNVLYTTLT